MKTNYWLAIAFLIAAVGDVTNYFSFDNTLWEKILDAFLAVVMIGLAINRLRKGLNKK